MNAISRLTVFAVVGAALAACSGGGGAGGAPPAAPTYQVGGTTQGLSSSGLILALAGVDTINVSANGTFVFPMGLVSGSAYSVTVQSQPSGPSQLCNVANSSGHITTANVSNIVVSCTTPAIAVLAGQLGGPGNIDGPVGAARFNSPEALAIDAAGTLYVADTGNETIRMITPAGSVTTIAGLSGAAGFADGVGSAARFADPVGITVDHAGNVYVADHDNNVIRKLTALGVVTTFAGQPGVAGSLNGVGSAAQFWGPVGIAADPTGNLYVGDSNNYTIRKITPAAAVTTIAGQAGNPGATDGNVSVALFSHPRSLALDASGHIYVADWGNLEMREIAGSTVTTLERPMSTIKTACGDSAIFCRPGGVAVNAAGVYVSEDSRFVVDLWKSAHALVVLPGSYNAPSGLALDSSGVLYIADAGDDAIRTISPAGAAATLAGAPTHAGSADGAANQATFNFPNHPAIDSHGNVFVPDSNNFLVRKITPAGEVSTFGSGFVSPSGIVVDAADNLYVTDGSFIRKVNPAGVLSTFAGESGSIFVPCQPMDGTGTAAVFCGPDGIAIDSVGNLYVADSGDDTIRKITPAAMVTTLAGSAGVAGSADGVGSAARFNSPRGVATDSAGNVYVADLGNLTIRKINPAGSVTTLAGSAGVSGFQDGTGSAARFAGPISVATDVAANVYVADTATIRLVSPAGAVTTIAGTPTSRGILIGDLPGSLSSPLGIAFDASASRLIVTDTLENVVLLITPP